MHDDHKPSEISGYEPEALLAALPVGIILTDPAKQCLYVNRRWRQLTGLTPEQSAGDGWLRALDRQDRARVLAHCTLPASQTRELADRLRFHAPDGTVRLVSAKALPLLDEGGNVRGYLCTIEDVSGPHESDQSLRRLTGELHERVKELNCLFAFSHIVEDSGGSLEHILQETVKLLPASWEHAEVACARVAMTGHEFTSDNYSDTPWKQRAEITVRGE
ncbi:MAG: PAS domain-containing protein, partial [Gemmatimonadales bacterium]